jgi:serine/threonine protein kinase
MGVVHLARRGEGARVALKVLRPHIVGDDEARRRLEREVGSLRRIRSKWVAEIVDADPWAPVPYVATRYVPGLSLHDFVHEEGPIEGRDLTWFAACLAEGLASVHAVGVLHRDVKPSNVLMEGRTPILIDFGLARVADDPRLTNTGWLLGTPGYLAPEILYGEDATDAADIHSWAATVAATARLLARIRQANSRAVQPMAKRKASGRIKSWISNNSREPSRRARNRQRRDPRQPATPRPRSGSEDSRPDHRRVPQEAC